MRPNFHSSPPNTGSIPRVQTDSTADFDAFDFVEKAPAARAWFSSATVFLLAFLVALAFALATERVWEDFYITFKSSKNLVEGRGLVFHAGEKVHTFTSPLGVLLPALCHLLTGGQSDQAAIWLFRVLSSAALAAGVALLYGAACRLRWHPAAAGLLVLWLVTDAKSVDFSINGMETGLLLGSLAWILRVMLAPPRRQWLHLGLAWGALMWTRPDGFVYIAALSLGGLIFADTQAANKARLHWVKTCLLAGLVCTALYLPWFLTAWWYYGTPVPHTVTAKGNAAGVKTLWGAAQTWLWVHLSWIKSLGSVDSLFMPSGYFYRGWPDWLLVVMRFVGGSTAVLWLLPRCPREVRVVSFAFGCLMTFLGYFPATLPAGWYLPGPAWLALFALGGVLDRLLVKEGWLRKAVLVGGAAWLALSAGLLVEVARMSKVEQVFVDDGNRREIGLWLKQNSQPGDSMFMECLGYFGYFSELKTYDFPGMSSPEVVAASKKVGLSWPDLIRELRPTWLALRPLEASRIARASPGLLGEEYREVRVFDASPLVERMKVRGQGLLAFDCTFILFKRQDS